MFRQTLTGNTNTDAFNWFGGDGTLAASGTFSSGSVKLQASIDLGVTWFDAKDADGNALALSANGALSFSVGNCKLRTLGSGATVAAGTAQVETVTLVGPTAVAATSTLVFTKNPAIGDKLTVVGASSKTYTFASTTGTNNIVVGANLAATLATAVTKISGDGYPVAASLGTTLTFTAATAGTVGNGYVVMASSTVINYFSGFGNYPYTGGKDAGVLTASGNITATLTSALVGTITINVPVLAGDTLAKWTEKVGSAVANDPRVSPYYTTTFTGSTVVLTVKSPFKADDSTLLLTVANGTPSPALPATYSSVNTTAGVATTPSILISIEER